jgi:hypothetical protein
MMSVRLLANKTSLWRVDIRAQVVSLEGRLSTQDSATGSCPFENGRAAYEVAPHFEAVATEHKIQEFTPSGYSRRCSIVVDRSMEDCITHVVLLTT